MKLQDLYRVRLHRLRLADFLDILDKKRFDITIKYTQLIPPDMILRKISICRVR